MYQNNVDGYMVPEHLNWLHERAKEMASIAEVGSWKGRSTKALLDGCKGVVYAVDHFQGSSEDGDWTKDLAKKEDIYQVFMRNVGHYPNLRVIRADSLEGANQAPEVDMVFIDATHTNEACLEDLKAWLPKTKKLISGHDYQRVSEAVKEMVGEVSIVGGSLWYRYL